LVQFGSVDEQIKVLPEDGNSLRCNQYSLSPFPEIFKCNTHKQVYTLFVVGTVFEDIAQVLKGLFKLLVVESNDCQKIECFEMVGFLLNDLQKIFTGLVMLAITVQTTTFVQDALGLAYCCLWLVRQPPLVTLFYLEKIDGVVLTHVDVA